MAQKASEMLAYEKNYCEWI